MPTTQKFLASEQEVRQLVDEFYARVRRDDLIGPIFGQVDWDVHLPKLTSFWSDLLFGSETYRGRPFPPHLTLNLELRHFERWLTLFFATVDDLFIGAKAEEVKARALRIARNFVLRLGLTGNGDPADVS